jgi:AcrR family transcriptional regulator
MALESPKPADRRVQRTRRTLREAIIALILERGWDDVTVQDVCARADVGRSTFYVHFADKEELLLSGFDDLERALRAPAGTGPAHQKKVLGFALGLLEHAQEYRRLVRALVGKRSGQAVQKRLRQLVTELVRDELSAHASAGPLLDAAVLYVSGGFLQLGAHWLDSKDPVPAAELEALAGRLTAPIVRLLSDKN